MKEKLVVIKDRICKLSLVISAIYLLLRITMIVLTVRFDFSLFFRNPDLNLWAAAWILDVVVGFIAMFSSILYFKNRILSFVLMLTTVFSLVIFIFAVAFTERLTSIEDPILKENYAISQDRNVVGSGRYILSVRIYKEVFPLVYKLSDSIAEEVTETDDKDILYSFEDENYKISEDGKTLSYGRITLSLE